MKSFFFALTLLLTYSITGFSQCTDNVFVGPTSGSCQPGASATANFSNTAVGSGSQAANTSGIGNTSLGAQSLQKLTTGHDNVAIGVEAQQQLTTGVQNIAIGSMALFNNVTGGNNTAVGTTSLETNTASNNSALGFGTLNANTSGTPNDAFGFNALHANTTGSDNVAMGTNSLLANSTGDNNTAMGTSALAANTSSFNSAFGTSALSGNTSGSPSEAFGYQSLFSQTTGGHNVGMGYQTLYSNITGSNNVAIGSSALYTNTGSNNIAIGYQTCYYNTTGGANAALGEKALFHNTTGSNNSATGFGSLLNNTSGNYNTANGYFSLENSGSTNYNTGIGYSAGNALAGNAQCTFLGALADVSGVSNLTNATAVGYGAQVSLSNTMEFGNSSVVGWGFDAVPTTTNVFIVGTNSTNGNGAFLTAGGTWTNTSTREKKEAFTRLDKTDILNKIGKLDISKWKYKGTDEYHIGPMAEDFYAAFNVGIDNKSISTIDPSGVALLAIQALKESNDALENKVYAQLNTIAMLNQTVSQQERIMSDVLGKLETLTIQMEEIKNCCNNSSGTGSSDPAPFVAPQLFNAVPNPASSSALIYYYVPQTAKSAEIILTDVNGRVVEKIALNTLGYSSSTIAAGSLAGGLYDYTLRVDDKLIATKRLSIIGQ